MKRKENERKREGRQEKGRQKNKEKINVSDLIPILVNYSD